MMEYKGFEIPEVMSEIIETLPKGYNIPYVCIYGVHNGNNLRVALPFTHEDLIKPDFQIDKLIRYAKETIDRIDGYTMAEKV